VNSSISGINPGGEIVGTYQDADGNNHGFLFYHGSFTSIDFPGAIQTRAYGINPQGDIVGDYLADDFTIHGFIFARN
jgi:probable HAF family extracellular repeat protein